MGNLGVQKRVEGEFIVVFTLERVETSGHDWEVLSTPFARSWRAGGLGARSSMPSGTQV